MEQSLEEAKFDCVWRCLSQTTKMLNGKGDEIRFQSERKDLQFLRSSVLQKLMYISMKKLRLYLLQKIMIQMGMTFCSLGFVTIKIFVLLGFVKISFHHLTFCCKMFNIVKDLIIVVIIFRINNFSLWTFWIYTWMIKKLCHPMSLYAFVAFGTSPYLHISL